MYLYVRDAHETNRLITEKVLKRRKDIELYKRWEKC